MKSFWLSTITSLSALAFLVACGGGVSVAGQPVPVPESPVVVVDDKPLPIVEPALEIKIGSAVGERVPDFEVTFLDGRSVSREGLAADDRPAFLFFMATW